MLHPTQAVTLSREHFHAEAELTANIYKIENFYIKAFTWNNMRMHSNKLENVKSRLFDEIII